MSEKEELFISLLDKIDREYFCKEELIEFLNTNDFFKCPASTIYHHSYEGGLLEHSLNTYYQLKEIIKSQDRVYLENMLYDKNISVEEFLNIYNSYKGKTKEEILSNYDNVLTAEENCVVKFILQENHLPSESIHEDTIVILGLFHDIYKIDMYDMYLKNEKVYKEDGDKFDSLGKYSWVSSMKYGIKDSNNRKYVGDKGFISYYLVSQFIPLTKEETFVLVNQFNYTDDNNKNDVSAHLSKYKLANYLHCADILATYCIYE